MQSFLKGAIALLIIIGLIKGWVKRSPKPVLFLIRHTIFKIPKDYQKTHYESSTYTCYPHESYPSEFSRSQFDLYVPKKPLPNRPTVLWVHGGGFVGGDKVEVRPFAERLADQGYAVVVMNYALVGEVTYPTPVKQVAECVRYLQQMQNGYELNMHNLFIAGDSAGAHIGSQFITSQLNDELREALDIPLLLTKEDMKGTLLYCGPYDVQSLMTSLTSKIIPVAFNYIGWAYFNDKQWATNPQLETANVEAYITDDFPPTYVTDGNTASFEQQSRHLEQLLRDKNIPVQSRYFDVNEGKTFHEYQFLLEEKPAQLALEDTLAFLNTYRG